MGGCTGSKMANQVGDTDQKAASKQEFEKVVDPDLEEEEEDNDDDVMSDSAFNHKASTKMRGSVSAEAYGEWNKKEAFEVPVYPKSEDQESRLKETLSKSFMFRALDAKEMKQVIGAMEEVHAKEGERMINIGDIGEFLFVIESGALECRKEINGKDTLLKTVEEGDVFGELAVLYNTVRAANVDAKTDCVLWKLDRKSFNAIVKESAQKKRERYEGFLAKVPLLKTVDSYERSHICEGLVAEAFKEGEVIIQEGDTGDKFYIVEDGQCKAVKEGMEDKALDYHAGDFFGELTLLKDQVRAATVTAVKDSTLLMLDRRAFKRLFGGSQQLSEAFAEQENKYLQASSA
ncbi:unnamed protein product [Amoebophrya sp. A120]|nr:unnamed protein product [Amoebophrya sp. A120]|eukprot:GSA120T00007008001.1